MGAVLCMHFATLTSRVLRSSLGTPRRAWPHTHRARNHHGHSRWSPGRRGGGRGARARDYRTRLSHRERSRDDATCIGRVASIYSNIDLPKVFI
jgi:hypothetical protein